MDAVAFHSLRITRHERKVSAEGDFVIVRRDCVLLLEVKGGRVRQSSGVWYYRDRDNVDHPSQEGPFRQAEGAMYGLRDRLRELLGDPAISGMAFGFAVVTPDCSLPVANVEWDRAMVIDEATLRGLSDLEDPLEAAVKYWRDRRDFPADRTATPREFEEVVRACRPDFEPVRSLAASAASLGAEMLRLTEQQYSYLDLVATWNRVVVEGGAGTGKTLLGVEAARREADSGRKVLLTCRSPVLAAWLRTRLPDSVEVVPHRALRSVRSAFDVLICDEAQDVLDEASIDLFESLLSGGLQQGRWVLLLDPNDQTDVLGSFDDTVYDLLKSLADGAPLRLSSNVRNTAAVVNEVRLVTGARLERPLVTGEGRVILEFPTDASQEAQVIRGWLRDLRREEMAAGCVTILTPGSDPQFLQHLPKDERARIRMTGPAAANEWPPSHTGLASVADFKGLENDVVILADLWDTDPVTARNLLYVGMTRSRVELRIAWPARRRDQIDSLKSSNVHLITETA